MKRADNSAFLARANARRHQAASSPAHHAIRQLHRQGRPVAFGTVAQSDLLTELWAIAAGQKAERSRQLAIRLSGMSYFAGVGH